MLRIFHTPLTRVVLKLLATIGLVACPGIVFAADLTGEMIELVLKGNRRLEGIPIAWNEKTVHLLVRDGSLCNFSPDEVVDYKKTAEQFKGYSPSELRAALLRELGQDYEVTGTTHYLVAHPHGQDDKWADRFEELYRSFVSYFSRRGFDPREPPYPLIGIVHKDREAFLRFSKKEGVDTTGLLGYYDLISNRLHIYDMNNGKRSGDWRRNATVLIHEATHQTAFNTGVHSRWCPPPKWLSEGLAMMFESPGLYDSQGYKLLQDRVNKERLKTFREVVLPHHRSAVLSNIVSSDDLFTSKPETAYAESWALCFFLVETEPIKFFEYLKRTSSRLPFEEYTSKVRLADFTAIFGADWPMLDAKFKRFIDKLK